MRWTYAQHHCGSRRIDGDRLPTGLDRHGIRGGRMGSTYLRHIVSLGSEPEPIKDRIRHSYPKASIYHFSAFNFYRCRLPPAIFFVCRLALGSSAGDPEIPAAYALVWPYENIIARDRVVCQARAKIILQSGVAIFSGSTKLRMQSRVVAWCFHPIFHHRQSRRLVRWKVC